MRFFSWFVFLVFFQWFGLSEEVWSATVQSKNTGDNTLTKLIESYFSEMSRLQPFWLSSSTQYDPSLSTESDPLFPSAFLNLRDRALFKFRGQLYQIDKRSLSEEKKPDYYSFEEELKIQSLKYKLELSKYLILTKLDPAGKFITMSDPGSGQYVFASEQSYLAFLHRMNLFSRFADQVIKKETEGISKDIIDDCDSVKNSISKIKAATNDNLKLNPFLRPLTNYRSVSKTIDPAKMEELFETAIRNSIVPGYKKLLSFLETKYLPICRAKSGLSFVAGGAELYRIKIAERTGLFLNPKEIATTGFKEVDRIKKEMDAVKKDLKISGSFKEFLNYIRTSPSSYFDNQNEMISKHKAAYSLIEKKLPLLFSRVPNAPLVFNDSPSNVYPAYFVPTKTQSFGMITLPVGSLKTAPIYETTSLMLHEGVPGHHLQLALEFENQNLSGLPQRFRHCDGFIEGWALYAESLGYEMGVFEDPVQRFGNLTNDMLRALRMVVDTELHFFGWTREQAISYMTAYLPYSDADIVNEVDRYINYPGQAVAYKVGQLKILSLRKKAQAKLGSHFDIKEFHSVVLDSGSISLTYLEIKINNWIKEKFKQIAK